MKTTKQELLKIYQTAIDSQRIKCGYWIRDAKTDDIWKRAAWLSSIFKTTGTEFDEHVYQEDKSTKGINTVLR